MAIVVTPLGTTAGGTILTLPCGTVAVGDVFIVAFAGDSAPNLSTAYSRLVVDSNPPYQALTADVTSNNSGNVVTIILRVMSAMAGTGSILISGGSGVRAATLYKVTGLAATPFDAFGTATGNIPAQTASTSANPTNAGDLAIAVSGIEGHVDDPPGIWESYAANEVHNNAQRDGTTGGGTAGNITIQSAASIVDNNTTVAKGYLANSESLNWAFAIATYQQAATSSVIYGTTVWGQVTGVIETNIRTYASHWTGTGVIELSGDAEVIKLNAGEYMEAETVGTGSVTVTLLQNTYASGDDVTIQYRTGATQVACEAASYSTYSAPFASSGFVGIKIVSTL